MGIDTSNKTISLSVKNYSSITKECLATTAEIVRPKKKTKVKDLSTITLGYIKDKRARNLNQNQRL